MSSAQNLIRSRSQRFEERGREREEEMGTSSAFAKSVWAPGVSGLWLGRGRARLNFPSTNSMIRFRQTSGSCRNTFSVYASGLFRGSVRRGNSSFHSDCSWTNGAGVALRGFCPQTRFSTSVAEKKGGPAAKKRSMKKKKATRAAKSDGLGLLANEVHDSTADQVEPQLEKCGSIHLILGPMFAGKSTALLKRAQEEESAGRRVALVKSDKDSRYDLSAVVTHDGLQMPCYAVPDLASFRAQVGDKLYREFDVIGIDEAQFFPDLYEFCLAAADYEGKTIIAAGLDGDFLRRKFGSTVDLVRVADSVVKLASRCEICGKPAIFSFRKTLDIQTEVIGGADVYMPVCRQHYVGGQMVVDSACTVLEAHQVAHTRKDG